MLKTKKGLFFDAEVDQDLTIDCLFINWCYNDLVFTIGDHGNYKLNNYFELNNSSVLFGV